MATQKVFISYDYDNDRGYKNLLIAWSKNSDFDFFVNDQSTDISIDSTNAGVVRRAISAAISGSTYFLCLVGRNTHKSTWVGWEIRKAIELGKRLIVVKIDTTNTTPSALLNQRANWAMSFSFDAIKKALDSA